MPTVERIETWRGQDVLDGTGDRVGHLEEVYYDADGREPVLLLIKHGRLSRQLMLVPVSEAVLCRDYIRLPFTADQINQAQAPSTEDELSGGQVASIGALFKCTLPANAPVYSSSMIERRNVEAENARQRAVELEAEAKRRAQEVEEARQRASAAAEEAGAAERAREQADAAAFDTSSKPPAQT